MKERIRIINTEGKARRGEIHTPHGVVQTPAFMNVATCGAIKGAVSALDLKQLKCQVQLCNTYHLHLRPGDEAVKKLGGIRRFTRWEGPVLTDSGKLIGILTAQDIVEAVDDELGEDHAKLAGLTAEEDLHE